MRIRPAVCALLLAIVGVLGCGPSAARTTGTEAEATSTSVGGSSGAATVSAPTSSTGEVTTTAGLSGTTTGTTIGDGPGTTLDPPVPDLGGPELCDPYNPDCPSGQKCSIDFTDRWWRARCVAIAEDPAQLDEPCTVQGALGSGLDDCDAGLYCWDYDAQGHGQCWAFCQGDPPAQTCPAGMECQLTADSAFNVCLRPCDPLLQDCPAPGNVCIPANAFEPGLGDRFACWRQNFADGHTGELGAVCDFATQCGPSLVCVLAEFSPGCPVDQGCCEPVCATDAPNECPGQGQACVAWFPEGTAPPGQDNVGVCAIPP